MMRKLLAGTSNLLLRIQIDELFSLLPILFLVAGYSTDV
jgi:hypothetical protein